MNAGAGGSSARERLIGWAFVGVQIVLLLVLVSVDGGDAWATPTWVRVVAQVMFLGGIAVVVTASVGLGKQLTPTPEPKEGGTLRTGGLQGVVRHPIYSGVLLLAAGMVLRTGSVVAALVGLLLVAFFNVKARWEEQRLRVVFPQYDAYATRVPRFVPRTRRGTRGS